MTWLITVGEGTVESDDFTIGDLGQIEKESETYWSIANPLRSSRVARAFLRVAYRRSGRDPEEVDGLTLGQLKSMFDFRADADDGEPERPMRSRRKQTSRGSQGSSQPNTTGPRPLVENSA
jgi:hypothetical protein